MIRLGTVRELWRYPVKSMAGTPLASAALGWHGVAGDRRFAFRRVDDRGSFPWLNASKWPELLLYRPAGEDASTGEPLPTHVTTPAGATLGLRDDALRAEIAARSGAEVELMWLKNGTFDDAYLSVISAATVEEIGRDSGVAMDTRRFRPNVVLDTGGAEPWSESDWIGGTLLFGDEEPETIVGVSLNDVRCMMINLDPDSAVQDARVMKSVVKRNGNVAGVYGAPLRTGELRVGQSVWLERR